MEPTGKKKLESKKGWRGIINVLRHLPDFRRYLTTAPRERRLYTRFQVSDDVYVVFRHPVTRIGRIINISRGGIAFSATIPPEKVEELFEMDIFLDQTSFCLEKVRGKLVWDAPDSGGTADEPAHQYGFQFTELTERQVSQIEHLLKNHSQGEDHSPPYLIIPGGEGDDGS